MDELPKGQTGSVSLDSSKLEHIIYHTKLRTDGSKFQNTESESRIEDPIGKTQVHIHFIDITFSNKKVRL